jgi:hypothetical protein
MYDYTVRCYENRESNQEQCAERRNSVHSSVLNTAFEDGDFGRSVDGRMPLSTLLGCTFYVNQTLRA